jgi:SnoaL-like protein
VADGAAVVAHWADAFNARNLAGMLVCLAEHVDFHPLRLNHCDASYSGHDGVRDWWTQLNRGWLEYRIAISETDFADDGRILSGGLLTFGSEAEIGPFCALHSFQDGLIVEAHHYLSDPDMIEHVGLLR